MEGTPPPTPGPQPTGSTTSETLVWINLLVTSVGFVVEFLIFLPLVSNIFRKNSNLTSGFFVIFTLGCGIDLIYCVGKILMEVTRYEIAAIAIYANLAQWYSLLFFPFWMTVLALNRLTALVFLKLYQTLWSRNALALICLTLLLYPLIVDGFTFFTDLHCRLDTYTKECESFMIATMRSTVIIGSVHACATLILGLTTLAFVVRLRKRQKMSKQANLESRLLIQTLFSSFLLVIVCFFELWAAYEVVGDKFNVLRHFSNIFFDLWHFLSVILLIAVR